MTQQEIMDLARWHAMQASVSDQDFQRASAHGEPESGRRAYNLYAFHTKAASDLRTLAVLLHDLAALPS